MNKILNFLISHLKVILFFYVIIQALVLILYFQSIGSSIPNNYDYFVMAEDCLKAGSIYPTSFNLYDDFIIAPLYVNFILFLLHIYNSIILIGILNIILNMVQLFFLYKITQTFFDNLVAKITALFYILYLNNFGMIILNLTELFFGVLILSSIYFYIKDNRKYIFFSGVLAGASIAVRPIGWALLVSLILIEIYLWIKVEIIPRKIFLYCMGFLFFIVLFGTTTYFSFNHFVFTSDTGGYNILIGANDLANGGYNEHVFEDGNVGYIPVTSSKNYIEKNEYWGNEAKHWIINNKLKWLILMPIKIIHTYIWDDIAISDLLFMPNLNFAEFIKYIIKGKSFFDIFDGYSVTKIILYFIVQFVHLLYYYLLLFLMAKGIIKFFKTKIINLNAVIILLFFGFGLIITMIVFGGARYKYPYIIPLLSFAAFSLKSYKKFHFLND